MGRDKKLDLMRGWAVFHMFFMHVPYWLNFYGSGWPALVRSWLLFTMAVYFFVTGAVNIEAKRRPWGEFVVRRAKVLMLPYYRYALLCTVIAAAVYVYKGQFTWELLGRTALSWVLPIDQQIMPLPFITWAVWFVPVYLSVIIVFPLTRWLVEHIGIVLTEVVLVIVFLVVENIPGVPDLVQKAAYYPIFAALGTQWPTLKHRSRKKVLGAAALMVFGFGSLIACVNLFGGTYDMQINKFPPNHLYLLFNFGAVGLLYILLPAIACVWRFLVRKIPLVERAFHLYSSYSVYAFMYHTFPYVAVFWLLDKTGLKGTFPGFVLSEVIVIPAATMILWAIAMIREKKDYLRKE